jgi:hypothetical protein
MVFLSLIGLVLVGIFLAIDLFMIQHKLVFFYSNLVLITAGGIISLIFHAFGLTGLYFAVIVILAIVTWLHPIVIKKKSKK